MEKSDPEIVLEARHISKQFPGVLALDDVSLKVYAGKVNAIVGENGAGKSTLMNILSGVYPDYQGEVLLCGRPVRFSGTADAQRQGIAMIHQELNLIPYLDITQNIFLGREPLNNLGLIDHNKMKRETLDLLERLHFDESPESLINDLRPGQQQIVEIAKALSLNARVLIMDEPTSSLSEKEAGILFRLIRELLENKVGVVYITHKMDEITLLADYVTVLRDGCFIEACPLEQTSVDELVRKMVGRERKDFFTKKQRRPGKCMLEVRDLCLRDALHDGKYRLKDISFEVYSGEVLGIYGLMGAGRTDLMEALFGYYGRKLEGQVSIEGRQVQLNSTNTAVAEGLALIPEDRKSEGLILDMSIEQNTTLASLKDFLKYGLLSFKKERTKAEEMRSKLKVKSYSGQQLASQLSGGNQQKVVLSKWLLTNPKIILLDEPTRGIDIRSKNEIYELMDDLAGQGLAIVMVSSELPEILAVSDRIICLCEGRISGRFERDEFSGEALLKAALPDKA
ncbi:MAG: sugar ABC transporter ATP-binding protein [Bacteroidales bacterium]|nr:sugar ABC transporter ATP-binding protein [Bacteroidales bacterium]MDD3431291.1 sugar ABC transporter ATP-binding protein [Bacteroidales bacterium]MDD4361027.1 sugar ABC transporter ATP-binding protein [Bacteroidales bacterium]MDD4430048.1 sugar ABC transporter ATP-binding protein [Bacteroidales bacterium]